MSSVSVPLRQSQKQRAGTIAQVESSRVVTTPQAARGWAHPTLQTLQDPILLLP